VVRRLYPGWKRDLIRIRPETVLRWHRRGWRLYWRWRSGRRLGRPRLTADIRELIATWRARTGSGALSVSAASFSSSASWSVLARSAAYCQRRPSRPPSQSWRAFLANHAQAIWAADLFVVQTLTFQTLWRAGRPE
jgi:putative transposase